MTASKIERLLNLVICLLSTRTPLTAERIRGLVSGYDRDSGDRDSDEAFSRMFERDKAELRELGIPLETHRVGYDTAEGYRINRDAYSLADITLSADEAAAVAVATGLWQSPELMAATQGALLKLRAAGVEVDADATITAVASGGVPALRDTEEAVGALFAAIDAGRAVRFGHRTAPTDPYTTRTVEPWGVVTDKGRWFLVGHDRDRGAPRTFRLSRVGTDVTPFGPSGAVTVPDEVDLRAIVARAVGDAPTGVRALLWVADGRGAALRRHGIVVDGDVLHEGRIGDMVEVELTSASRLARAVAGHGADVVVRSPATLRDDVVALLAAHAGAGGREAGA